MSPFRRWKNFIKRLRRFFVTTVIGGIVVVLPITLFIVLIRFIFNFIAVELRPLRTLFPFSDNVADWLIDLLSFAIVIAGFFLIGLIIRTEFGKKFFTRIEENWLRQLPFYSVLRDTVQQFASKNKSPFSQVVLVDVFSNPTRMTGFVTDDHGNGTYTVFVPTGPNPTNGFIFHVTTEQIEFLDVRPEDAMRTIIGVGTGSADLLRATKTKEKAK